jgi:hypothetical protein
VSLPWSLSKLGTFEKCRARYKYRYIDGLKEPKGAAASRGIDKHKIVEDFVAGITEALPADLSYYHGFLSNVRQSGGKAELQLALRADWTPCAFGDSDAWWRGVLDALVVLESKAHVFDWKTGKIYDDHDDQKDLYAAAVFSTYSEVEEIVATHVYLDLGQNREKRYTRADLPAIRARWEGRVNSLLSAEAFFPNPQYSCRWCGFAKANGGPCRFGG